MRIGVKVCDRSIIVFDNGGVLGRFISSDVLWVEGSFV